MERIQIRKQETSKVYKEENKLYEVSKRSLDVIASLVGLVFLIL